MDGWADSQRTWKESFKLPCALPSTETWLGLLQEAASFAGVSVRPLMSCLCRSQMGHERTTDVQVCSSPLENDISSILPSGEVEWEEHREEADALNSC